MAYSVILMVDRLTPGQYRQTRPCSSTNAPGRRAGNTGARVYVPLQEYPSACPVRDRAEWRGHGIADSPLGHISNPFINMHLQISLEGAENSCFQ